MYFLQSLLQFRHLFATPAPHVTEPSVLHGPEAEYARRLARYAERLSAIHKRHQLLWISLLASAVATTGAAALALWYQLPCGWLFAPAALLLSSFRSLTVNARRFKKLDTIVRFYEGGLARLRHKWQGQGISGEEYRPAEHLYAADLDLFGVGSLFEVLCTARTGIGRATLAEWLLHPASPAEIGARQEAVTELRENLELQEEWASAGEADPSRVTASTLAEWAEEPIIKFHVAERALALILPLLMLAAFALAGFGYLGTYWPIAVGIAAALELAVAWLLHKRVRPIAEDVTLPAFELAMLAPLLDHFQCQQFQAPLLNRLRSQLSSHFHESAAEIARLRLWSWLLDLSRSEYFALACSLLLWKTNFAMLVEGWRARNCQRVMDWLEVVGEFEALLCLARYSFENPAHTFPRIGSSEPALFHAEGLGHPLLAAGECIPCDVSLGCAHCQLMILSGSNMSGKSTLLRSIGLNAVLAMAGAPVRAARLEMSPLRIGCSIAVHDSLLDGKSRFMAEVERLKQILALERGDGALVLLDEVLAGTNSQDRLFGTQAVLGRLLRNKAIAIVTTHDLALTELADQFERRATNAHFEESYENGAMRFDYKLRPGVLTRTNGANVIAALGLLS